nr:MAG TPA: hypothetical protein [Caudoviricetes sp.]
MPFLIYNSTSYLLYCQEKTLISLMEIKAHKRNRTAIYPYTLRERHLQLRG